MRSEGVHKTPLPGPDLALQTRPAQERFSAVHNRPFTARLRRLKTSNLGSMQASSSLRTAPQKSTSGTPPAKKRATPRGGLAGCRSPAQAIQGCRISRKPESSPSSRGRNPCSSATVDCPDREGHARRGSDSPSNALRVSAMFPDVDEEEDLAALVSWGLPGYSQSMANTKAGSTGRKSAAGKTAKRATTKKGSKKTK